MQKMVIKKLPRRERKNNIILLIIFSLKIFFPKSLTTVVARGHTLLHIYLSFHTLLCMYTQSLFQNPFHHSFLNDNIDPLSIDKSLLVEFVTPQLDETHIVHI